MVPWLVNTEEARLFLEAQRPLFDADPNLARSLSEIKNYGSSENTYAGYAMATFEFGSLSVVGGLRAELTSKEYEGKELSFDAAGDFSSISPKKESDQELRIFPNAQIFIRPGGALNIRAAYSKTISRPDYYLLAPYVSINNMDSTIARGNPNLDPMLSDNIDLISSFDMGTGGFISAGLFIKKFTGFITSSTEVISGSNYDGYTNSSFENSGEDALIYGLELELSQRFTFLPGAFGNLGGRVNYTWSQAEFNSERGEKTELPGHSPHVLNAAIDYRVPRFRGQVSYHRTAPYVSGLAGSLNYLPSAGADVYADRYSEGFSDLSFSMEFRLSDQFLVWGCLYNMLNQNPKEYEYDREFYPTMQYLREGIEARLGIRFEL